MSNKCTSCGAKIGTFFGKIESTDNPGQCVDCFLTVQNRGKAERRVVEEKRIASLPITTAPTTAAGEVERELDIVTAECVFGMNIFRDMFAGVRDVVGGRSEASQSVLKDARKTCLRELRKEAAELGADAVVAVDLDYGEFSGGGKAMLMLVASGTAVVLKPHRDSLPN